MLVSICIPTFNGQDYLKEALESASAQTYGSIEIVVVDDCSNDGTLDIANDHARLDPRVRISRNEVNQGLVGNWNRCVLQARGEWLKFLFQDDLLDPGCLEAMVSRAVADSAAFVACDRRFRYEKAEDRERAGFYERHRTRVRGLLEPFNLDPQQFTDLASKMQEYNLVGEPTVTLLKKSVFSRVGLFDPLMIHMVDAEYWIRVGLHFGVSFIDQQLCTFRVHGGSASSENASKRHYSMTELDPLIMRYKVIFDPMFQPLRDRARATGRMRALRRNLHKSCISSRKKAKQYAKAGDSSPMTEWQTLLQRMPIIQQLSLIGSIEQVSRNLVPWGFR
jgi:glycosyltransferase involved in cell wall biosynthesis